MSNLPPLNTDTIWAIINEQIDDSTVNQIVWHYLGYRYDNTTNQWDIRNYGNSIWKYYFAWIISERGG
jgi:hypothetical protein